MVGWCSHIQSHNYYDFQQMSLATSPDRHGDSSVGNGDLHLHTRLNANGCLYNVRA